MSEIEYDVIVAGAGNAAVVSALAACEQGAKVLVLEKAPQHWRGGNTYFTTGVFRTVIKNAQEMMYKIMPQMPRSQIESFVVPDYTKDQMYGDHMQLTEGMADPEQLELVVKESTSILEWMTEQGFVWEPRMSPLAIKKDGNIFFPGNGLLFQVRGGGAGLSDQGFDLMDKKGIKVYYNTKVSDLLRDSKGSVVGVVAQNKDGVQRIKSKGVILGCGGFEANPAMRAQYLGKNWDLAKVRGTPYNTGDMLNIAMNHGANPVGHWGGCHAVFIDAEAPQPAEREMLDRTRRVSGSFGIIVNSNGERFIDEGEDRFDLVYAKCGQYCLQQPHLVAYQIFDSKGRDILEDYYQTGRALEVNSVQELAEGLEIDVDRLIRTIDEFNAAAHESKEFVHSRKDGNSTIGISPVKSNWARKINIPPYVAYATCCGITFTYGGIQVNRESQVLNTEGEVIPGLYACGEIVGGLFYHNYPGGTGLTRGAVMGRIAGRNAAA
ncbi:MAG: FAD-dependent tricarballylate dehydrogenase TcuA [Candidatus Methanomethylicus sp.]|nr:FAD-dependent tricarballylate dehydrogenase TcuA [Candidatus Methanomethylicus sp.]